MTPHEVWTSQCEVAREVLAESGVEDALRYLIGGKFLDFLALAEDYPQWRDEIPNFLAEIRNIFAGWQIGEFVNASCRPDALAHVGGQGAHSSCSVRPVGERPSLDGRDMALLEWAAELLSGDDG